MNLKIIVSLTLLLLLTACTTISKTDCLERDWQQQGFDDGSEGVAAAQVESYAESCSRHDVQFDRDVYLEGHAGGIRLFCEPDSAFEKGERGYRYAMGLCPADLESFFLGEYLIGLDFYGVYRTIDELERNLAQNYNMISQLNGSIDSAISRASGGDITRQEEDQLRQSVDSMQSQIRIHEDEILRIEELLTQRMEDLEVLKETYNR